MDTCGGKDRHVVRREWTHGEKRESHAAHGTSPPLRHCSVDPPQQGERVGESGVIPHT
ncbi:hypothetical protein J6590_084882 [Homalodisca vitripennis]|nr:hypothetical protein J6590_084882 [Homalodisca vitripennis]